MGIGAKHGIFAASAGAVSTFANQYSLEVDGSNEYAEGAAALTSLSELTQASVSFWVYLNDTAAAYLVSQLMIGYLVFIRLPLATEWMCIGDRIYVTGIVHWQFPMVSGFM